MAKGWFCIFIIFCEWNYFLAADLLEGMRGLVFAPPDNQIFGNVADPSEASQLDFNTVSNGLEFI